MTLLTGQARTEKWFVFSSVCSGAHFEQQEIILVHCSGVCIFVGPKLVILLGNCGELICLTGILSCFSLFHSYPFASKGVVILVYITCKFA